MTGPLYRLGRVCSHHHWPVIGVWLVLAIALVVAANAAGEQNSDNLTLGLDGPTPIASYVPLLMFAILCGLSVDYEVFLLTQIQEHWRTHAMPDRRWSTDWPTPAG
jgi:uncharacterized membrane protein YdfJ with MMPL/SSD domain